MPAPDNGWVVVSGAGGALGRTLVSHFAAQGSRVLALDRTFEAAPLTGVTARAVDLLVEADVRQALGHAGLHPVAIAGARDVPVEFNLARLGAHEPVAF